MSRHRGCQYLRPQDGGLDFDAGVGDVGRLAKPEVGIPDVSGRTPECVQVCMQVH